MIGYVFNQCTASLSGINVLLYLTNVRSTAYQQYSYIFTTMPSSTRTTFAIGLTHRPAFWFLDDIRVYDYTTFQMVNIDGSFESNNLLRYYTLCALPDSDTSAGGRITMVNPQVGSYAYVDGTMYDPEYLMQTIDTVGGRQYFISFWLKNYSGTPNAAILLIGH